MSIFTFLFKKKRRTVVAQPTRSDGFLPADRLILPPRAQRAQAVRYEAFVSGDYDDALFFSLASLRGLNVAERAAAAEVPFAPPPAASSSSADAASSSSADAASSSSADAASSLQWSDLLLYH